MSGGLCEAVLALGLTFGGICEDQKQIENPLPNEDKDVWAYQPPMPEPEPIPEPVVVPAAMPRFPPVIIKERVEVTPPPAPQIVYVEPPKPDPVEIALQSAFASRRANYVPLNEGAIMNESVQLASLGAPSGITPPDKKPVAAPPPEYDHEGRIAGKPVDNSRIFTADRYITGILETGINSQLDSEDGGTAIIQTTRDTFGYHNRNILIPKGSRMVCDYDSPKKAGSTRLSLQCNRILMGETRVEIYQLASTVGDAQGHAGITGHVDNRWWEKYGSAIILGAISATVQGLASVATNSGGGDSDASAAEEAAANLSERFGEISASVLEQTVNLAPVVTISQGTRIQIRPQFDWYIPEPEEPTLPPTTALNQ